MRHYLFLSGVGRSGTTALRRSLGRHPDIYYAGTENNIVQEILAVAQSNWTMTSRRRQMLVSGDQYRLAFVELLHQLVWPDTTRHDQQSLMAAVNLPVENADFLFELLPTARLVCLVRNGIGVIGSRMAHRSFRQLDFEDHCRVWLQSVALYRWAAGHGNQARVFRQEWMIDEHRLRAELEPLLSWLDLTWSEEVLQGFLEARYLAVDDEGKLQVTANEYRSFDDDQRRRFEQARFDRWTSWTDQQRQMFNDRCADAMRELQYEIPWLR